MMIITKVRCFDCGTFGQFDDAWKAGDRACEVCGRTTGSVVEEVQPEEKET